MLAGPQSNADWLGALRPPPRAVELERLRLFLRRSLAAALASKHRLAEADFDDFAQEALLRVLEKLDTFRGRCKFTTWAMAVAIRVAYSQLRRRRWTERPLDGAEELAGPGDPAGEAEREDLLGALRRAIDSSLTEKQRTVILAELSGMPGEELAASLNTNVNALYKLYHDARKRLRRALTDAGFSDEDVRECLERASKGAGR